MRLAIICLTRGYTDLQQYNVLIQRNIAIYNNINIRNGFWPWPLLIFHEGNVQPEHQEYIRSRSGPQPLFFIDIGAAEFSKPVGFDHTKELDKRWPWGYKCMCRFFAGRFRHYVSEFDYTIRIDEDCILQRWPAETLGQPGALLQYPYLSVETHDFTNELLPKITRAYIAEKGLVEREFYNQKFPYTNVWIMARDLWKKPFVEEFVGFLEAFHFSLYYRIGDLPILGVVMNQFLEAGEHCLIKDVEYYHLSHNMMVTSYTAKDTS